MTQLSAQQPAAGGVVSAAIDDGVLIVSIDNPPVNALGQTVRQGLLDVLRDAASNAAVKAVVIRAEGALFSGGADINEFGKPPLLPSLSEVIAAIEALGKPVAAAIHGTAFGGALELALGCGARIAAPGAKVGLPEIKLGLIPGAGGTQRLSRLIGARPAFDIMLTGDPVPAQKALTLGIVDEIATGDLVAAAKAAALTIQEGTSRPMSREGETRQPPLGTEDRESFEKTAADALKAHSGSPNVAALVSAVRAAFDMPLAEGLALERQWFVELLGDERSNALRYVFFAERKATRVADLPPEIKARPIHEAAVIGAGTMGTGIAICFADAGILVTLIEADEAALARGLDRIAKTYDGAVQKGKLSSEERNRRVGLARGALTLDAAASADIIVEAVFEEMDLKKQIFAKLDAIAKPGAILATNTSYLDVNEIAAATKRPGDVLGMHFFSPANIMRLLEVVRAGKTSHQVLKTAMDLAVTLRKLPVPVGVCHGFVGNRMLARRSAAAERVLLEGAFPQDVDRSMLNFGFKMGPYATGDLAGLDIGWRIRKATGGKAPVADALCELGRFGQKTGRGYYAYRDGARAGEPDPEVERLIVELSARHDVSRRAFEPDEIVERLLFPMINEGARILSEGIAARASDIDIIWCNGYGWPSWRGGPMYYADTVGLSKIAASLDRFADLTGDETFYPSSYLSSLAASGGSFTGVVDGNSPNG